MSKNSTKKITEGIEIEVYSQFVPEQSNPQNKYYFFAYTIDIRNIGSLPAKLINRHWIITDGQGRTEEVKGPGVIGKQPRLMPGESFQYTSFCPLGTTTGTMHGTYQMVRDNGEEFYVEIPKFFLYEPSEMN